jgi:biopolymer transport protein ExbD
MSVSALIDVVFLLLIYFMVTASLIIKEGDISFQLPSPGTNNNLPIEVLVEIRADGSVELDGMRFSSSDTVLKALATQLSHLKQLAAVQRAEFYVNILPHRDTLHHRVVDVMDACAAAGVKRLGFNKSI